MSDKPLNLEPIKSHLPPLGFWSTPHERTLHKLIAEIERLRSAAGLVPPPWEDRATVLKLYEAMTADVGHGKGCPRRNDNPYPCSCGLDAFERALDPALPSSPLRSPKETP